MTEKEQKEAFNRSFGERVRLARRSAGLKAEECAEWAGITPQFLSEVERGKKGMSSYNLCKLARCLRVTSDYLLYGRSDTSESWELAAEHMASMPPALRSMAADVLEFTVSMVQRNVPR